MKTLSELQKEIETVRSRIEPLSAELTSLLKQKRHARSVEFITANKIVEDDVELSDGEGKPWFGNVWAFANWMKLTQSSKRWAEWNGIIYYASDLLNGKFPNDMPGMVSDLP